MTYLKMSRFIDDEILFICTNTCSGSELYYILCFSTSSCLSLYAYLKLKGQHAYLKLKGQHAYLKLKGQQCLSQIERSAMPITN